MGEASFDSVAYPGHAFPFTHPDSLATIAWLHGLAMPDVARARVIELGCGDGGNLIPMAATLPGARFVGVDLAASAIARGRERVAELGLANIDLQVGDIATFAARGRYDFAIAHGVYSWVPEPVRRRLLELYAALLSDTGLGFLSFLAYPGGHFSDMVRGMARIHARRTADAEGAIRAARSLARALAEPEAGDDPYHAVARLEAKRIVEHDDASAAHDVLAEANHYEWLVDLAAKLATLGLQFAADAELTANVTLGGNPTVAAVLALAGDDPLMRSQYLDFARLERFRSIIVARAGAAPAARPIADRLRALHLRCDLAPEAPPSLARGVRVSFVSRKGARLTLDDPLAKAAMLAIGAAFPCGLRFADVVAASIDALRAAGLDHDLEPDPAAHLAAAFVEMLGGDLLRPYTIAPSIAAAPGARPRVSPLARLQLAHGESLTNQWHEAVDFDAPGRRLAALMDGTRDRATLAAALGADLAKIDAMTAAIHRTSLLTEY